MDQTTSHNVVIAGGITLIIAIISGFSYYAITTLPPNEYDQPQKGSGKTRKSRSKHRKTMRRS